MTHPLPDRDSIFFLRCYRARNYSHAWLQMSVYLCQFSPVKIYVSTPHRCLSLHRAQAATHEHFYPCLHLKETQVAQQDRMLGWLQQLSAILLILFYFINTDSFLSVCVRGGQVLLPHRAVGLWQSISHEVKLLLSFLSCGFFCVCGHVMACNSVYKVMALKTGYFKRSFIH